MLNHITQNPATTDNFSAYYSCIHKQNEGNPWVSSSCASPARICSWMSGREEDGREGVRSWGKDIEVNLIIYLFTWDMPTV